MITDEESGLYNVWITDQNGKVFKAQMSESDSDLVFCNERLTEVSHPHDELGEMVYVDYLSTIICRWEKATFQTTEPN